MDAIAALQVEMDEAYKATFGLLEMVDPDQLNWKPSEGNNWMTTGQLLKHLGHACGWCVQGFVSNNWDMSEFSEMEDMEGELPTAEKLPTIGSVEEAVSALRTDQERANAELAKLQAGNLENPTKAPWGSEKTLFGQILDSIKHLKIHQAQLFYYLKMQGKDVNTMHMWGM